MRPAGRAAGTLGVAGALALGIAVFLYRQWEIADTPAVGVFPLDDSWIHLHFARNLAEGQGFAYNPGVPVAGSTAPLWTLLLGGAFAVGGSHLELAKALGVLAALGAALVARRLGERWTGDAGLGVVAGALTALSGPLVWGALSGMEVGLAALLTTAALCVPPSPVWRPAALLGLAVLARPEAVLLAPLVLLAAPLRARRALVFAAVLAALLAPCVAFNLATTGSPLPATASAKVEGGLVGLFSGHRDAITTALFDRPWQFEIEWVQWLWNVSWLLPGLAVVGLIALWWRRGTRAPCGRGGVGARTLHGRGGVGARAPCGRGGVGARAPCGRGVVGARAPCGRGVVETAGPGRAALTAAVLLLHPLAMALLAPYRGPGFQEGRYSIHLLPLAMVVAVVAVGRLMPAWTRARCLAVLALFLAALGGLWPAAGRYGWAIQNIEAMQVRLGQWVARETPPGARLALNDVGAIAYLSRREVVDLMGLVTPAILPYRREGDAGVLRYLERACPDYLIIFPAWFPGLSERTDLFHRLRRLRLANNTVSGADEMVVYETAWNRWRADRRPCG